MTDVAEIAAFQDENGQHYIRSRDLINFLARKVFGVKTPKNDQKSAVASLVDEVVFDKRMRLNASIRADFYNIPTDSSAIIKRQNCLINPPAPTSLWKDSEVVSFFSKSPTVTSFPRLRYGKANGYRRFNGTICKDAVDRFFCWMNNFESVSLCGPPASFIISKDEVIVEPQIQSVFWYVTFKIEEVRDWLVEDFDVFVRPRDIFDFHDLTTSYSNLQQLADCGILFEQIPHSTTQADLERNVLDSLMPELGRDGEATARRYVQPLIALDAHRRVERVVTRLTEKSKNQTDS